FLKVCAVMGMLLARVAVAVVVLAAAAAVVAVDGQMSPAFYDATCPALQSVVRRGMAQAVQKEARMGASILRLFFHDCFVNGCDASVLLDDTANFTGEKNAGPNANSLRGYEVIDAIKAQVEASCKATVSCADIVALAARDAVSLVGGPSWTVQLGRRDGRSASQNAANTNLPPPDARLADLLTRFSDKGLDARALTALSGAHTVGWARCTTFRTHIYNDTGNAAVDAAFATQVRAKACPSAGGDGNLTPLELRAPAAFDNGYFQDLVARRVLLRSDQELYGSGVGNGSTDALVRAYAANATLFAVDFAAAMVRMGNLALTGKNGEVRLNCRRVN
uniref:Peroxidase n=1 Tax=Aegilops tauschii subsp. strangulata TaxID=200361 RepID=A0A453ECJ8_AEGTS